MSCTHGGLTGRRRIQSTVVASTQSVFRTDSDRQLSFEPRSACWFYFKRHSCHAESPRKEPTSNDDNFRQTFLIIDNATLKTKRQITSNILFNLLVDSYDILIISFWLKVVVCTLLLLLWNDVTATRSPFVTIVVFLTLFNERKLFIVSRKVQTILKVNWRQLLMGLRRSGGRCRWPIADRSTA